MSTVRLPGGVVALTANGAEINPLTSSRTTDYRFDLLDHRMTPLGTLTGVSGGGIDWTANAQVKGAGRLTVVDNGTLANRQLKVGLSLPLAYTEEFEDDNGGWGALAGSSYDPTGTCVQVTTGASSGAGALKMNWANPASSPAKQQGFGIVIPADLEIGETYTVVMRMLHTGGGATLRPQYMDTQTVSGTTVVPNTAWQTVAMAFTVSGDTSTLAIINTTPTSGQNTLIDRVNIYHGATTDYPENIEETVTFDWQHVRIRPVLLIEGLPETPLGVFLPTTPTSDWTDGGRKWNVELMDRSAILQQDCVEKTYSVGSGANVLAKVKDLIRSTGESVGSITTSTKRVQAGGMAWKAGTSKLTIINDLLDSAGFYSLWVDGNGNFRVQPYVAVTKRHVTYTMQDGVNSIYLPDFTYERDDYSIPNKVIAITQGNGDQEGFVGVATNENKHSPYSYQARGRWIVDVKTDVELTTDAVPLDETDDPTVKEATKAKLKAAIKAYAKKRLAALSVPNTNLEIQHAPLPNLLVNDAVMFRRTLAGIDQKFVVSKTSLDFNPINLAKTTLSDVSADVSDDSAYDDNEVTSGV